VTAASRKPTVDPKEAVTMAGKLQNRKIVVERFREEGFQQALE
jgi:hypothetical protein